MIRILIIDDSEFIRSQVRQLLAEQADFLVVGEGRDGREAIELVARLRPDVIIMDVEMPNMDGIEAIEHIMEENPTPIVIHTTSAVSRKRNLPFEGIRKGALDVVEKPMIYPLEKEQKRDFISKLRVFSGIKVFKRAKQKSNGVAAEQPAPASAQEERLFNPALRVLTIAASTGGPKALHDLFEALPPVLPFPILLVQHINPIFAENFAEWLQGATQVTMKIAEDGETLRPNTCYMAPGGLHLSLRPSAQILLDDGPPVNSCKPSADVLFHAVARAFPGAAAGLILTGIGEDGADGLLAMRRTGAITLSQDHDSAVAYGMPGKAVEFGASIFTGNIDEIAAYIQRIFGLNQSS